MNWDIEIRPSGKWLDIDIKGIWQYRDMLRMYVKRDITVQYKQTALGPIWYVLQPLLATLVYMLVFGALAGISTDGAPMALFYMSGIMVWNYFTSVFTASYTLFSANAPLFGKVYFPRLIIPLSVAVSSLARLALQLAFFGILYLYIIWNGSEVRPTIAVLMLPAEILAMTLAAMAFGLIISSLTAKYHDLCQITSFGIQLYMYATPIIYPLSAAPEKYRHLISLNPLAPIFESVRYSLLGCGTISYGSVLYSSIFIIFSLAIALVVFGKTERNFIDTV